MTNNRINFYQEPSNKLNKQTFPTELTISEMPADGDESEKRSYEYEVNFEAIIKLTYIAVKLFINL